ncbi:transporter substrate-binding domain-containing protein [Motilimonas pumila]|uniref:Uncharacterized protein n=1 Tax=Motilimonas pumila TaxID=2303987 RepID=A0A418YD23_9GAMM|nr:transporter substrate-binding domain-containing protein [Motilimonas pumila]RJG42412.1 hypothetical protein D1Z90_13135 [Motilimonas pumila]
MNKAATTCFLTALCWLGASLTVQAQVKNIVVWNQLVSHPNQMVPQLLQRALEVTAQQYGDVNLIPSEAMEQGRLIRHMSSKPLIQVAVFGPTQQRERDAIAVRFPVTATLLSHRVCLIKAGRQAQFNGISGLHSLLESGITIGQHQDWPDTAILEANGINVWKSNKYSLLFDQLNVGRFDCFARGANEVVQEQVAHSFKNIVTEQSFVVYYPFPLFFFVNKAHPELAKRIELGLHELQSSGEFKRLFNTHFARTLNELNLAERNYLELKNPFLTPETEAAMQKYRDVFQPLIFANNHLQ